MPSKLVSSVGENARFTATFLIRETYLCIYLFFDASITSACTDEFSVLPCMRFISETHDWTTHIKWQEVFTDRNSKAEAEAVFQTSKSSCETSSYSTTVCLSIDCTSPVFSLYSLYWVDFWFNPVFPNLGQSVSSGKICTLPGVDDEAREKEGAFSSSSWSYRKITRRGVPFSKPFLSCPPWVFKKPHISESLSKCLLFIEDETQFNLLKTEEQAFIQKGHLVKWNSIQLSGCLNM